MNYIDPDKPLTDEDFKQLGKPMIGISELPEEAQIAIMASRGRPKQDTTKKHVSIRLDADLYDELKSSGRGWQTRANNILREAIMPTPQ